jgi:hypothetical protein
MKESKNVFQPPDPPHYEGIEKSIEDLNLRTWRIEQIVIRIEQGMALQTFTIADLAREFGISETTLRHKPWMLPHFGKADIGQHPAKWFLSTVLDWYTKTTDDERQRVWEEMGSKERRKAMGRD